MTPKQWAVLMKILIAIKDFKLKRLPKCKESPLID